MSTIYNNPTMDIAHLITNLPSSLLVFLAGTGIAFVTWQICGFVRVLLSIFVVRGKNVRVHCPVKPLNLADVS